MSAKKTAGNSGNYPWILWGLWAVLLLFAIWQNQERCLYQDSAYAVFRICNLQFPVEHGRWGMIPMLAPAWLAAKTGIPLIGITGIISATGILIGAGCSYWCFRINRDNQIYILPLMVFVITGPEWFYLSVAEMVPALCFASVFFAYYIKSENAKSGSLWISVLLLILSFFTHPGVLPLLVFMALYPLVVQGQKKAWLTLAIIVTTAFAKKFLFENTGYENDILQRATDVNNLKNIFDSYSFSYLLQSLKGIWILPLFIFISSLILSQETDFKKSLILGLLSLGAIFSIVIIFSVGDSNLMMEKNFAPAILMLLIPASLLRISNPNVMMFFVFITVCIFFYGLYQRYNSGIFYRERLLKLDAFLNRNEIRDAEKIYAPDSMFQAEEWRVTWALPYESAMRSKISTGKTITVKTYSENPDSTVLQSKGMFYGAPFAFPIATDTMNSTYFTFHSNTGYKWVKPSKK